MTAPSIPPRLVLGSWRELSTVAVVAALAGGYAAVLIVVAATASRLAAGENGARLGLMLAAVATVFILIALYVSAVVMTNAVATVLAGRLRALALLRLLGADAQHLRAQIVRQAGTVALAGAVGGTVFGVLAVLVGRVIMVARGTIPGGSYPLASPWLVASAAAVTAVTAMAAGIGSRSVLTVSPADALRGPQPGRDAVRRLARRRVVAALVLVALGVVILALAVLAGLHGSAAGFLLAFLGGASCTTGILIGARLFLPAAVAGVGRLLGRGPATVIARRNAVTDPDRTTRSTIGLAVGVGLVVTFASGLDALRREVVDYGGLTEHQRELSVQIYNLTEVVVVAIVVVSAVIAAVGFASTLSLTVLWRTREIGLLRALGLTRRQVRGMVTAEAVAMSAAAILLGAVVGIGYGSAAATSLVGGIGGGFALGVPRFVLILVAVAAVVLVIVSARTPARRAVAVSPVEALRFE